MHDRSTCIPKRAVMQLQCELPADSKRSVDVDVGLDDGLDVVVLLEQWQQVCRLFRLLNCTTLDMSVYAQMQCARRSDCILPFSTDMSKTLQMHAA